MNVVFLGTNNYGREIYEWLCDRDSVEVQAILTEKSQLTSVQTLDPDIIVAAGFTHIVPPEVLSVPDEGCLNVHPGVLPATRGFNPNVWSIVENHPAGATIHYMNEGIDTGDIVATREVPVSFADTGKDVYQRVERACIDLFCETWPEIESGTVTARPQDPEAGTYHRKAEFTELCRLDPDEEVRVIDFLDRLRALTFPPFDNARIEVDGERYYVDVDIRRAERDDGNDEGRHGMISSY